MLDASVGNKSPSVAQSLSANLRAVLNVAGRVREDDRSRPLFSTEIQRRTGIARSTVRSLISPAKESGPNPDLRTLVELAKVVGIPVPFLLMGSTDWAALIKAVAGLRDASEAARTIVGNGKFTTAKLLVQILTELKVHPEMPPYLGGKDEVEKEKMDARNRWRERSCRVFSALIDRNVSDRDQKILLAALAASYVIHTTPHNPEEATVN
ncbi:TPA: XRE family transcriptional regulator [Pseudomonas aeruginosa]